MPFKNNEDKKAWRRAYRAKNRERHAAWALKHYNNPLQTSNRVECQKIIKEHARQREIESDASCLRAVMRQLRRDIMIRDGVGQCSLCKKIKPKSQMIVKQYPRTWCRECNHKKNKEARSLYPERWNAQKRRTYAKIKADPVLLIRARIRQRLAKFMKRHAQRVKVKGSRLQYLGCNAADACAYIEQQFKKGMTWDNYGMKGWHIDHVIPCSAFDLSNEDQRRKAFHYTNLQPLWASENLRKNDTVPTMGHQTMLILG